MQLKFIYVDNDIRVLHNSSLFFNLGFNLKSRRTYGLLLRDYFDAKMDVKSFLHVRAPAVQFAYTKTVSNNFFFQYILWLLLFWAILLYPYIYS